MTQADEYFNAVIAKSKALDKIVDAIVTACGFDPNDSDPWPFNDITFDWYDYSFELKAARVGWKPTDEQWIEVFRLGFSRCWICYVDDSELYKAPLGQGIYKAVSHRAQRVNK